MLLKRICPCVLSHWINLTSFPHLLDLCTQIPPFTTITQLDLGSGSVVDEGNAAIVCVTGIESRTTSVVSGFT